jgi:signal transduction histidine kinase
MATLRARLLVSFAAFAVLVAAIFGFSAAVLLYSTEDVFFNRLVAEEAARLEAAAQQGQPLPALRFDWMLVASSADALPADLRAQLLEAPTQREFTGTDGRHYHVRALTLSLAADSAAAMPSAWLVGEVSDRLVLRPNRQELLGNWALVGLSMLALAILLGVIIARRVSRPLSDLAAAVRAMDPQAPGVAFGASSEDQEIATVARALDDLQQRVAGFVAREHAFTRDVSHELRNPLAVVRSTATRLAGAPSQGDDDRRALVRIVAACDRLERTMRSLLELARERQREGPPPVTHVAPVLEDVILELDESLRERGLTPVIALPPGFALPLERPVLAIVLGNLIGNACHHAAPGTLRIAADGPALLVANPSRADGGDAPTRRESAGVLRADSPGHGLGLAISQRLCERGALTLSATTTPAGEFVVRLAPSGGAR